MNRELLKEHVFTHKYGNNFIPNDNAVKVFEDVEIQDVTVPMLFVGQNYAIVCVECGSNDAEGLKIYNGVMKWLSSDNQKKTIGNLIDKLINSMKRKNNSDSIFLFSFPKYGELSMIRGGWFFNFEKKFVPKDDVYKMCRDFFEFNTVFLGTDHYAGQGDSVLKRFEELTLRINFIDKRKLIDSVNMTFLNSLPKATILEYVKIKDFTVSMMIVNESYIIACVSDITDDVTCLKKYEGIKKWLKHKKAIKYFYDKGVDEAERNLFLFSFDNVNRCRFTDYSYRRKYEYGYEYALGYFFGYEKKLVPYRNIYDVVSGCIDYIKDYHFLTQDDQLLKHFEETFCRKKIKMDNMRHELSLHDARESAELTCSYEKRYKELTEKDYIYVHN